MKARLIAEAIERSIATRKLGPGSPVPSTRAIARRWKVSTTTAAHALRLLKEKGAVRAIDRARTVVAGTGLSKEAIVDAAITIADAEGLDAVSLRGVATALGAPVMSLYRHVRHKEELLASMADAALGEHPVPRSSRSWRKGLEAAARAEWRLMRRHPWLARLVHISRPQPSAHGLAFADAIFAALAELDLGARKTLELHLTLHGFVQGLAVNLEAEALAKRETGFDADAHVEALAGPFAEAAQSGRFPHFARLVASLGAFEPDLDRLFELGLGLFLDGLAAQAAAFPRLSGR